MLIFYSLLGIYIAIIKYAVLPNIVVKVIKEAFNLRSIIPVFLIGMQRAIFISESSLGTSAIAAGSCDNIPDKQGLIEVVGIYITVFIVALITFLIIATSNYNLINYDYLNIGFYEKKYFLQEHQYDILIDNDIRHMIEAEEIGITPILYGPYNNEYKGYQTNNWEEIPQIIEKIIKKKVKK